MNPRGGSAAGYWGAQNRVGNVNQGQARPGQARPGQARPVKCYNCNGTGHIARNCTQPKRPQNSEYYKDKMLLMQAQENGVALDAEQLLFLAGGQDNTFDDDAPTAQTMFMANLSSEDPVTYEAGPSYDSNILSEIYIDDEKQTRVDSFFTRTVSPRIDEDTTIEEENKEPVRDENPPSISVVENATFLSIQCDHGVRQPIWNYSGNILEILNLVGSYNEEIASIVLVNALGRSVRNQDNATNEHHYHYDIYNETIDFQLRELDSRFSEKIVELLELSSALDPRDGYISFNSDSILKLAKKYYYLDFAEQELDDLEFQLKHFEIDMKVHPDLGKIIDSISINLELFTLLQGSRMRSKESKGGRLWLAAKVVEVRWGDGEASGSEGGSAWLVAPVGCGFNGGGAWRRWLVDLVDRDTRYHFGVRQKISPEKFSGGGGVVVAGGSRWLAGGGGGWGGRER
nr:zinc finger MYM-type protein 1-like [Tanacetum cinerariifolium]